MVETINAIVFKESVDTKVGITVVAIDGKVYADSLAGFFLFGATALQRGDKVVTVNGTLVEGMDSSEVVGIIKAAEGDITVVAKRAGQPGETQRDALMAFWFCCCHSDD